MRKEKAVLHELIAWASRQDKVRVMLLTSSRANPNAFKDVFTDYDIELAVTDIAAFSDHDAWLSTFGNIMAHIKENHKDSCTRLVLYDDGVRIDFQVYLVEELLREISLPMLPEEHDIGYTVLLDKDSLTGNMRPPTHTLYNIAPPTQEAFISLMHDFWWDTTYVAKSLWRDELYFAKYMLDDVIRFSYLRKIIEWYIGLQHDWKVNPNKYGRWFKRYLSDEIWSKVELTFAGSNTEDNWDALFRTTALFRDFATEIAGHFGFEYPDELDHRVTTYLTKIRNLDAQADDFL